jgi:hypothetical protein
MKTYVYFAGRAVSLVGALAVCTAQGCVGAGRSSPAVGLLADMVCCMVWFAIKSAAWLGPAGPRVMSEALASVALRSRAIGH